MFQAAAGVAFPREKHQAFLPEIDTAGLRECFSCGSMPYTGLEEKYLESAAAF